MHRDKKKLALAIVSAISSYPSFDHAMAQAITTQGDIDSQINAPLQSGNQTITTSTIDTIRNPWTPSVPSYLNIVADNGATLDIHGDIAVPHDLTLTSHPESGTDTTSYVGNILSRSEGSSIRFHDINTLTLDAGRQTHGPSSLTPSISNIHIVGNGSIQVDPSVHTLILDTTDVPDIGSSRPASSIPRVTNILVAGQSVTLLSDNVELRRKGETTGIKVNTSSTIQSTDTERSTPHLFIGTDAHQIQSLTVENEEYDASPLSNPVDYGVSNRMNEGIFSNAGETTLNAKNITVNHAAIGIDNNSANLHIGSEALPVDTLALNDTNIAVSTMYHNAKTQIFARNIDIEARANRRNSDPNSSSGFKLITRNDKASTIISTGTGTNEGLYINGNGGTQYAAFLLQNLSTNGTSTPNPNKPQFTITKGNVRATNTTMGICNIDGAFQVGSDSASSGGDFTIDHTTTGLYSYANSSTRIHAKNLNISDNVNTAINTYTPSRDTLDSIDIQTDGTATLHGQRYTIYHHSTGTLNINTAGTGNTVMLGRVQTNLGHVNITFRSPQSYFDGDAWDSHSGWGKTDIDLQQGARWYVTNNSRVDQIHIDDNSLLDLSHRGDTTASHAFTDVHTTHLDNGTGSSGTITFGTDLAQSYADRTVSGHSDTLTITGSSQGRFHVMLNDYSHHAGTPIRDGYVLLVRDESPTGAGQATFTGDAHIQNGGLFARPVTITDQAPDANHGYTDVPTSGHNWYATFRDSTEPVNPPIPTNNNIDNQSFAKSRYLGLYLEQDTLRKRVGDWTSIDSERGIWARLSRGRVTTDGLSGHSTYNAYQLGYDHMIKSSPTEKQFLGVSYHHRDLRYGLDHFTHDTKGDADVASLYWTTTRQDGQYLDIVGRLGQMKAKGVTFGDFPEHMHWSSPYQFLGVEYGRHIPLSDHGWYVEPQSQLTYSHLGSASYTTNQGNHGYLRDIDSLIGRLGTSIGHKTAHSDYYVNAFWHHEFKGNVDYTLQDKNGNTVVGHDGNGASWLSIGFGGEYRPTNSLALYGDIEKNFGGDVTRNWSWNVGARFSF